LAEEITQKKQAAKRLIHSAPLTTNIATFQARKQHANKRNGDGKCIEMEMENVSK
jgi:hypothetical protein